MKVVQPALRKVVFVCFVLFSMSVFPLKQNITLAVNDAKIEYLLQQIGIQTGYKFSYTPSLIDKNKRISLHVRNKTIHQVLPQVIGNQVQYKISGEYIILLRSTTEIKKSNQKPIAVPVQSNNRIDTNVEQDSIQIAEQPDDIIFLKKIPVCNTGISIDSCHRDIISKKEEEMRTQFVTLITAMTLGAANIQAQTDINSTTLQGKVAQATFVYPLGTDGLASNQNAYNMSLNVIGGLTGEIKGFEVASVYNLNNYSVSGLQLGGVFNISGLKERQETNKGVQVAGVFNFSNGNMPVQISGFYNGVTSSNLTQIAGVINTAESSKVQVAGFLNLVKNAEVQISGTANIAKKSPVQIGVINISDSTATQIGVFNASRHAKFQLGVVNARDTADGVSLGILNLVKRGGINEVELAVGDYIQGGVGFRTGTRQLYTILSAGMNFDKSYYGFGFGLGSKTKLIKCLDIDFELVHHNFYSTTLNMSGYSGLVQFRPLLDLSCLKHVSIFAGPTFNLSLTSNNGVDLNPSRVIYKVVDTSTFQSEFWVGFTAGLRYKF